MHTIITSPQNPRVKQWSALLTKRGRDSQGKFILEGVHLLQEAVHAGISLETVLYSVEKGWPNELAGIDEERTELVGVSDAVLAKCSDTETPQGVIAIAPKLPNRADCLWDPVNDLVAVVDGVQDPGNLGTIIRSADAVAVPVVLLGKGTVDLYNPKTIRSTMGSLFHLTVIEGDIRELLPLARAKGIQVAGTSLSARNSCYELDMTRPTWLIFGNEGRGISADAAALVSHEILIPMSGRAESLNVAMAATVLLFEAQRQRGPTSGRR